MNFKHSPLSKTNFLLFLKHPAWAWYYKNKKNALPPVDSNLQALFDEGKEFEKYAEKRFLRKPSICLPFSTPKEYASLLQKTKKALEEKIQVIFQGRVQYEGATCIFDVLERVGENEYALYEIKSSTRVKKEHIPDLAFQTYLLRKTKVAVKQVFVIVVDNTYVKKGEINPLSLSKVEEVTEKVECYIEKYFPHQIQEAVQGIQKDTPPSLSPTLLSSLGSLSEWLPIYRALTPTPKDSILNIGRITLKQVRDLYHLKKERMDELEEEEYSLFTPKQISQIKATRENKQIIQGEKIKTILNSYTPPLYFLDYETTSSVIPSFENTHPYQQVPFQYSLHTLKNGILTHTEYLHENSSLPVEDLAHHLKKDIGEKGTVLVWYETFEKTRNKEMGEMLPEYTSFFESLNSRVKDLMNPFKESLFVDKNFYGSASIKAVLPALVPALSYKKLAIQEGESAKREWNKTVFETANEKEKKECFKNLREYCAMDTLAMVKIYEVLCEKTNL